MPPIRLCERHPHYFEFHGKPVVFITSGEHYGAVLNADFDRSEERRVGEGGRSRGAPVH